MCLLVFLSLGEIPGRNGALNTLLAVFSAVDQGKAEHHGRDHEKKPNFILQKRGSIYGDIIALEKPSAFQMHIPSVLCPLISTS